MGTWGPGIFSDDLALDVRDVWREALMDGLDDAAATARVLEELAEVFHDEEEALVAWPALAAAQHQTGRLQLEVRDRALAIIDAGGDLASWREESAAFVRAREKALRALAAKLRGPQPPPKTLKRPPYRPSPLDVGDVVHLRRDDGVEGLFVVVGLAQTWPPGTEPVVAELLWDGGPIPDEDTLTRLPLIHEDPEFTRSMAAVTGREVTMPVQHLWRVASPTRGKYALANYGRVVATGVLRPDAGDHERDQSRGFGNGPSISGGGWDTVAAFMTGPLHDRSVEATRRLYGL